MVVPTRSKSSWVCVLKPQRRKEEVRGRVRRRRRAERGHWKTPRSCPREISVYPPQPHTPHSENMYNMYMIWRYTHIHTYYPDNLREEVNTDFTHPHTGFHTHERTQR